MDLLCVVAGGLCPLVAGTSTSLNSELSAIGSKTHADLGTRLPLTVFFSSCVLHLQEQIREGECGFEAKPRDNSHKR